MSVTYPQYPSTSFPDNGVDTMERFSGVAASTKQYVDQFYKYYDVGDFINADKLLTDHPELKNIIISETKMNELRDNILALQQLFLDDIETWITNVSQYKGDWNAVSSYNKFSVVSYTVNSAVQFYQAITNIPKGTNPTNTNYWICITLRGEQGASGAGLSPRGNYVSGTTYYQYDMVLYDYKLWYAIKDNPVGSPNKDNADWGLFFEFNAEVLGYDNSESGLSALTMQDAIDEVNDKANVTSESITNINNTLLNKAEKVHTHDDRYYTEAETNNLLNGKANSSHTHMASQISGLPTSLPANGGNADTIDGYHIAVVNSLPASQVANTIYFVRG